MRKTILFEIVSIIVILSYSLNAQSSMFENQMLKSCLIQMEKGGLGTGILYKDSTSVYLITARHNFYQEVNSKGKTLFLLKDTKCKLITYPRDIKNANSDSLECELVILEKTGLLKYDQFNDVATLKLAELSVLDSIYQTIKNLNGIKRLDKSGTTIQSFEIDEIKRINELNIGDEVALFGFPRAIGLIRDPQYDFNRPLLRKGTIAGLNSSKGTFILDCVVYQGNSGGPLLRYYYKFETYKGGFIRKMESELIGIVSEFIPLEEKWTNLNYGMTNIEWDNSGYSVIVPIDYALNLIETY